MLLGKVYNRLMVEMNQKSIRRIQDTLVRAGGKPYVIGGAVRDELLGIAPKDVDFVVTGIPLERIAAVLSGLGKVTEVGKSFGVVKATIEGEDYDFATPRTKETSTGDKHTDFQVQTDHNASIEDDLSRRDFTFNALAKDVNGKVVDLFGGKQDMQNRIIRTVGKPEARFSEDPLRILRAIQFAARLDFDIEEKTAAAIEKLAPKLKSISSERIYMEFEKAWLKAKRPDKIAQLLSDLGVGEVLFGKDFRPIPVKIVGSKDDIVNGNFVSFFLCGGEYKNMRPTNDMLVSLQIAKLALGANTFQALGKVPDIKAKLPLVADIVEKMSRIEPALRQAADKLKRAATLPLTGKELQLSGGDIMSMGIKGKDIGVIQNKILSAIESGQLKNNKQDILNFMQGR